MDVTLDFRPTEGKRRNRYEKEVDWASRDYDGIKGKSHYKNQSSFKQIFDSAYDYFKTKQWD